MQSTLCLFVLALLGLSSPLFLFNPSLFSPLLYCTSHFSHSLLFSLFLFHLFGFLYFSTLFCHFSFSMSSNLPSITNSFSLIHTYFISLPHATSLFTVLLKHRPSRLFYSSYRCKEVVREKNIQFISYTSDITKLDLCQMSKSHLGIILRREWHITRST